MRIKQRFCNGFPLTNVLERIKKWEKKLDHHLCTPCARLLRRFRKKKDFALYIKPCDYCMFLVRAHSCCAPPWEWTKWCKTVFATCFLPRSRCAVPQVFGKEFWDLGPDSIWALVHINSFKCHYKIQGAFYWLSWCSEVFGPLGRGDIVPVFYQSLDTLGAWTCTSERDTLYKFSSALETFDLQGKKQASVFTESYGMGGNASNCFCSGGQNCIISPYIFFFISSKIAIFEDSLP